MGKEIGRNASKSCWACAKQVFPFSIFFCGCKQPKSIHMFIEIVCKGTNKWAKYKAKRFFCFYFRTKVPSTDRSMLRISERFAKFAIKREQKKFTFYAEREQIRPLCQIYLRKSEPTNETRAEYACMLCLVRRRKTTGQREYLRPIGQCYE